MSDVWVGYWKDCDCIVAVVVDEPDYPKDTARDVAEFIRRGYRVYRYSNDQYAALTWRCEGHRDSSDPRPWRTAVTA